MRRLGLGGLACAGVLLLALAAPQPRALRPPTLTAPRGELDGVGVVWKDTGALLARVDAATLQALPGPTIDLGWVDSWAVAPDRNLVAVASHSAPNVSLPDSIRFLDPDRMTEAGPSVALDVQAYALAWASADRIVALTGRCCSPGMWIVTIDAAARRGVARTPLARFVVSEARGTSGFVLLTAPTNKIGPATLVVADAHGVRSVRLTRIAAGNSWNRRGAVPIGKQRRPALAVDTAGSHAYVLAQDNLVADVDVDSLAVAYHRLSSPRSLLGRVDRWLEPPADAKALNGTALGARWLGDGLIAVAGSVESASIDRARKFHGTTRPWGLALVDTRDWSTRTLDRGADRFAVADGLLLVAGGTTRMDSGKSSGMGIVGYAADMSVRFALFAGRRAWVTAVTPAYAFVGLDSDNQLRVVELATGRVVGTRGGVLVTPLVAAWPLDR